MSDYIKRNDALGLTYNISKKGGSANNVYFGLKQLKVADVAPVRYGEWIHPREYGLNLPEHYCSECRAWEYSDVESKFCPNCGAKMDKDNEQ